MDIEETSGVIHSISGQRLNEETIAEIHAKTDGWVSGLLLLLKRGSFDQVEPCMLARKTPEVIFDYLNDSVFQDLAENHQRMLLTLCFMPVVSARAASVLCGRDAPEVMEMLSKDNRFIYRIWTGAIAYDFHPLFREFLQKRAFSFFNRSEFKAILSESADILKTEGNAAVAVRLYIQADNFKGAVDLILSNAMMLSIQGRVATLMQWINALPPEIAGQNPWLLFWQGICVIPESPGTAKPIFQKALEQFELENDPMGCFMALSGIMDSITLQFSVFQELDAYIDRYSKFEDRFGEISHPDIRLKLTSSMLSALVLRRPDSQTVKKWKQRGWDILTHVRDASKTVPIFSPLIILHIFKGELQSAGHLVKMFADVSHQKTAPLSYLILQDLKVFHSWLSGDFEKGLSAVQKGMTVEKETGIRLIFLGLRVHGAAAAIGLGRLDKAEQLLDQIPPFLEHQGIWMQGLYHI